MNRIDIRIEYSKQWSIFFPNFGVFVVTECSFTQLLQFYVRSKLAILGKFRFINYGSYLVGDDLTHRGFYKLAEIGNIGVRGFTIYVKINKSATEVLPPKEDWARDLCPMLLFLS